MKKKDSILLALIVIGIIISNIILFCTFKKSISEVLETTVFSILTGCIFALPTYTVNLYFNRTVYSDINKIFLKCFKIVEKMKKQLSNTSLDSLKLSCNKLNELIDETREITNNNYIVNSDDVETVVANLSALCNSVLTDNCQKNCFSVEQRIAQSYDALDAFLNSD